MAESRDGGGSSRFRQLRGWTGIVRKVLLAVIPVTGVVYVLNVHVYLGFPGLWKEQYVGLFIALVLACVFLNTPATKRSSRVTVTWYDVLSIFLSLASGGYVFLFYPQQVMAGLPASPQNVAAGAVLIVLALESARRLMGWVFVILTSAFILYPAFANLFPGFLSAKPTGWPLLITHLFLDSSSFLYFVGIVATAILAFILFGQAVFSFGGGKLLGDLALSVVGRYRGGPAKASVVGSSLFGTMSGSAISNIIVTGTVTIPLMKRIGYPPHIAAAIEATASNGGMLMPPVMGIVAFIMADMIGMPYRAIAIAAFIPAVLYYVALFVQVHLEAVKAGLSGLPPHEIPPVTPILKKCWVVLLPFAILVYTLFIAALPPAMAAVYATILGFLFFAITRENRAGYWRRLLSVLTDSGETLLIAGALCICAGFIVAATGISGLGTRISMGLVALGGGNVLALLVVAAVASIVLGMGLPASASYILVAVLIAPTLVTLGVPLLAAHLFVMYYANMALITPPIALGVFVAAPMAGADPMRTGWAAMRLSILAYVVPFLFVFSPALLLQGPVWIIVMEVATATIGTFVLGTGVCGHFSRPLSWFQRVVMILVGSALLVSVTAHFVPLGAALKLVALLFVASFALWERKQGSRPLIPETQP